MFRNLKRAVKLYETLASGYYNVGNAIDIGGCILPLVLMMLKALG